MRTRKGRFAVSVSFNDKWINYADIVEDKGDVILNGVLEHAKEYSKLHKEVVVVYIANIEYEFNP